MHKFTLPLTDPILVFMVVLFLVLLVPLTLRKSNIPSIIGLIVVGVIIGPDGFRLIGKSDIMVLFGKVGLLYIMFLAGLELEFNEFKKDKYKASVFGVLSFLIPFVLGYLGGKMIFGLNEIPSVLLGLMLSSNTLISYPTISTLGLQKASVITTGVSGTVIADTIVLVILALTTAFMSSNSSTIWLFVFSFGLFAFAIFFVLPKLSRWFFKTLANDGNLQFLFTLSILFASAYSAELAGAEPIIGAFFAGLALNKLIPTTSTLMNRLSFVGHTLFIPFFLISVGMLFNFNALFSGYRPVLYASIITVIAVGGKFLAAKITGYGFKLTRNETNTLFGFTTARAAATLAIALVGTNNGLISRDFFNASVLLILITSMISSYLTERFGKKLLIDENAKNESEAAMSHQRILIPIANPKNISRLIELAQLIHDKKSAEPLYPLAIVQDENQFRERIVSNRKILEDIEHQASATGVKIQGITRIDINVPAAITRASKELDISDIIIGTSEKSKKEISKLFGNMLESILGNTCNNIIVSQLQSPLNITSRIYLFVPDKVHNEFGYLHWLKIVSKLTRELSCPITIYAKYSTFDDIRSTLKKHLKGVSIRVKEFEEWPDIETDIEVEQNGLYIFINSRKHSLSYNQKLYELTYKVPKILKEVNVLNIYQANLGIVRPEDI